MEVCFEHTIFSALKFIWQNHTSCKLLAQPLNLKSTLYVNLLLKLLNSCTQLTLYLLSQRHFKVQIWQIFWNFHLGKIGKWTAPLESRLKTCIAWSQVTFQLWLKEGKGYKTGNQHSTPLLSTASLCGGDSSGILFSELLISLNILFMKWYQCVLIPCLLGWFYDPNTTSKCQEYHNSINSNAATTVCSFHGSCTAICKKYPQN